jgi:hypothetical protein
MCVELETPLCEIYLFFALATATGAVFRMRLAGVASRDT